MQVLLQKNIFQENEYDRFYDNIRRSAITQQINVIPFLEEFDGSVYIQPDYCFGSTRFIDVCRAKGLPVFKSFDPIEPIYSGHFLNEEGWDCELGDIDFRGAYEVFVKPYREKFFTGTTINRDDLFTKTQLAFSEGSDENKELVRVSPVRYPIGESRFFVLDGKVVAGSVYKCMMSPYRERLDETDHAWKFAQSVIDERGAADEGFVIDIAWDNPFSVDSWGYKIVELNNLNSSGFYKCDLVSIIGHLVARKTQKEVDKDEFV